MTDNIFGRQLEEAFIDWVRSPAILDLRLAANAATEGRVALLRCAFAAGACFGADTTARLMKIADAIEADEAIATGSGLSG